MFNYLKKGLQLKKLSHYRGELMGFAAVLILICHSTAYLKIPRALSLVLSFGNIGNEVFLFLSGIGLYYSLTKKIGGIKRWYVRRYKRILIPYLILAIPIGLYYCKGQSLLEYILYITTLSYWTDHNTAWFIAVLIPLYMITPALLSIQKKGIGISIGIMIFCYVMGLMTYTKGEDALSHIIYNVIYVMPKIPAFLLGLSLGEYVKMGKMVPLWTLVALTLFAFLALYLTKHLVYSYIFFMLPVLYILILLIEMSCSSIKNALKYMGDISLESYLTNTMLPIVLLPLCSFLGILGGDGYLFYTLLIIIGISMANIIHKFCKVI